MNFSESLKITTLGGLSITRGEQPVEGLVSRKVEALLVYLAYEQREHPRELLAELLWDDLTPERAMGNLRTALSNLQTSIPGCLVATRQTVTFSAEIPCWLDAVALMRVLEISDGASSPAAIEDIENALHLYQGDFLAGFRLRDGRNFERWMMNEAERIRAKVMLALPRLLQAALHSGRYSSGIDHGRRLLTLDPLSEEGQRGLMSAYAYSGQRALALKQYENYVALLREELHIDPPPEITRLYKQIQSNEPLTPPLSPEETLPAVTVAKPAVVRLPSVSTPFIERPTEIQQIVERLTNPDCRLLTIVGPGGIGKTRLAIQAASKFAMQFPDGIYFVPLASTQAEEFIPLEIAGVLQLSMQSADEPRRVLIDYLANKNLLLVLDNFEHLIDSAGLVSDILDAAPSVKILVTSREWLNLQGEWLLPVDGMEVPQTVHNALQYSAVQLFAACAARIQPRFVLENELDSVIKICQAVEGMPLSIELAATWLRVIPASEIAQQIDVRFLSTGVRNIPERHRSIQAVFDYSWRLLSTEEADALTKLSVFRGPFSRTAAMRVAAADMGILAALVEKSLIRRFDKNACDMHELLRQYAFDQLSSAGAMIQTQDAHLNYYVSLTADPDARLHGEQQIAWLDQLEQEHENLRAALTWALESGTPDSLNAGLEIGGAVWEFWLMRGHIAEGRGWLDRLLSATRGIISKARGHVTQGAGYLTWIQGDSDKAEALHREGLEIRRIINDKAGMGGSLSNLGVIAWGRGDFKAAREFYEQALAARREANYRIGMASVLTNLSLLLQDQGEYRDAITYATEALELFNELDDLQGKSLILLNVGAMNYDRGDWAAARKVQEEALELTRALGDRRMIGALLQNLGQTVLSLGDPALARKYLTESLELVTESGDKTQLGLVRRIQARLALTERRYATATEQIHESLSLFREVKAEVYRGQAMITLGDISRSKGEYAQAEATYKEALAILASTKNHQSITEALYRLAGIAQIQGNLSRAAVLLGAGDKLAQRIEISFPDEQLHLNRTQLSTEALIPLVQQGAGMDQEALLQFIGDAHPTA